MSIIMIMEGTKPMIMEGTRPPTGASPTQPYKCGQNVKVKTAERGQFCVVGATVPVARKRGDCGTVLVLTLTLKY